MEALWPRSAGWPVAACLRLLACACVLLGGGWPVAAFAQEPRVPLELPAEAAAVDAWPAATLQWIRHAVVLSLAFTAGILGYQAIAALLSLLVAARDGAVDVRVPDPRPARCSARALHAGRLGRVHLRDGGVFIGVFQGALPATWWTQRTLEFMAPLEMAMWMLVLACPWACSGTCRRVVPAGSVCKCRFAPARRWTWSSPVARGSIER